MAVGGAVAQPGEIVFQPAGASAVTLEASPSELPDVWEHTLPAPELPGVRLRSRG